MDQDSKRELRQLKREVKRAGGKHRRRQLKQGLAEHPEEAHADEPGFGRHRSSDLNGLDRDAAWKARSIGQLPDEVGEPLRVAERRAVAEADQGRFEAEVEQPPGRPPVERGVDGEEAGGLMEPGQEGE